MPSRVRQIGSVIVLALLIVIGGRSVNRLVQSTDLPLLHDYMAFWAAGKLNLNAENPFDPFRVKELQEENGLHAIISIIMWNPPWTLSLVMPFSALPPRTGQVIWLLLQLVVILISVDRIWCFYHGRSEYRWVSWVLAVTFGGTAFLLGTGQFSGFVLLGLAGFLIYQDKYPIVAGMFVALTATKPHLLTVLAVVFIVQAFYSKSAAKVILGGLIVGVVATGISMISNPDVFRQYIQAITTSSSDKHWSLTDWQHPTIASFLRDFTQGPFWVVIIPFLLGTLVTIAYWWSKRDHWDWTQELPGVILISFLCSPYGARPYDLVLLLLPLVFVVEKLVSKGSRQDIQWFVLCWLVVNVALLVKLFLGVETLYYVWVAPVLTVIFLAFLRTTKRGDGTPIWTPEESSRN